MRQVGGIQLLRKDLVTGSQGNPLRGRWVSLRAVTLSDYEALRMAELDGSVIVGYRHRGQTPGPEQWAQALWGGVLAQFVVVRNETGEPVGTVAAYGADHRNGHVHLAAFVFPQFQRLAWPIEGTTIFLDYLFGVFPFRKVYADTLQPNAEQFSTTLSDMTKEEGRRIAHEWFDGQYVDLITYAIYREDWEAFRRRGPGLSAALRSNVDLDLGQYPSNAAPNPNAAPR